MLFPSDDKFEVWFGLGAAALVFLTGWANAVADSGWALGLAFGWVSPAILAVTAGVLAFAGAHGLRRLFTAHGRAH